VSLQEAYLNTAVKIKSCTRASAAGKNEYNLERTKKLKKDILVLEKNEMPKEKTTNTKEQKKEIKSLQSKLSTYKKRLSKAIKDGKEKSIKTNQKNIDKLTKELSKIEKSDNREKYFSEFTIALTNSKKGDYAEDWSKKALEHIKAEFPTLKVISAVEHRDQHSPHMHILLYSPDKPITQVISQKRGVGYSAFTDTSRKAMGDAYSNIQHNFHSYAKKNIARNGLNKLQKGRKYVSLGQYKQKGNFELKRAIKAQKEALPVLNRELTKIKTTLDMRYTAPTAEQLNVYTTKKWYKETHYIPKREIESKKRNTTEYADKLEYTLGVGVDVVREGSNALWKKLEENTKKNKKDDNLKVDLEFIKEWRKEFNDFFKGIDAQVQKVLASLKERKEVLKQKISNHPDTLKQIELTKAKDKERQEKRALQKDKPQGRER